MAFKFNLDLGAILGYYAMKQAKGGSEGGATPNPYFNPETGQGYTPSEVPYTAKGFDANDRQGPYAPPTSRGLFGTGLFSPKDFSGQKNAAFFEKQSLENLQEGARTAGNINEMQAKSAEEAASSQRALTSLTDRLSQLYAQQDTPESIPYDQSVDIGEKAKADVLRLGAANILQKGTFGARALGAKENLSRFQDESAITAPGLRDAIQRGSVASADQPLATIQSTRAGTAERVADLPTKGFLNLGEGVQVNPLTGLQFSRIAPIESMFTGKLDANKNPIRTPGSPARGVMIGPSGKPVNIGGTLGEAPFTDYIFGRGIGEEDHAGASNVSPPSGIPKPFGNSLGAKDDLTKNSYAAVTPEMTQKYPNSMIGLGDLGDLGDFPVTPKIDLGEHPPLIELETIKKYLRQLLPYWRHVLRGN